MCYARGQMHILTAWRTFLESGEHAGSTQALEALDRRGRALGASIAARVDPGARVLIMLPPGIDFVAAVFGVFYAGAITQYRRIRRLARAPTARPPACVAWWLMPA